MTATGSELRRMPRNSRNSNSTVNTWNSNSAEELFRWALAKGGQFDVVCFGHNHRFEITPRGRTLLINPGEVYGGLTGNSTFVIYDTDTNKAERVNL